MARQRFIWPDLWTDPGFGRLAPLEQVLYIGCFSNADDEGRLLGGPVYLKTTVFPYQKFAVAKVRAARDKIVAAMPKLELYDADGVEYLAFTNWSEWQKPKYPKPSRLPPPLEKAFREPLPEPVRESVGESLPEDLPSEQGNDSAVGWVGLGKPSASNEAALVPTTPGGTQELLARFIDQARANGVETPKRVVGQLAQAIKALLDEGQTPQAVWAGLGRMVERRVVQPSLLANFVMEASLPRTEQAARFGRGMTTEQILSGRSGE